MSGKLEVNTLRRGSGLGWLISGGCWSVMIELYQIQAEEVKPDFLTKPGFVEENEKVAKNLVRPGEQLLFKQSQWRDGNHAQKQSHHKGTCSGCLWTVLG